MRKSYLQFSLPRIENDEVREVVQTLKSGWLTSGPKVQKFQENFRGYTGAKFAVAVNSCTAALFIALKAAGIKEGDEVITTPLTFAATANVVIHCGATPVFVDVDPITMNIDTTKIARSITKKTKAIIPVHFAGRACNMKEILIIAKKYKLYAIQDAAHSLETRYHGKTMCEMGDATAYSFYATKNLTTGEGGMLTTPHKKWADRISILAAQGMTKGAWNRYSSAGFKQYQIVEAGYKCNMMDLQAALGIVQLNKIEKFLKVREKLWDAYDRGLKDFPILLPSNEEKGNRHARHLYTVRLDLKALKISRDEFQQELHKRNIGSSVHFRSLHLHPYYQKHYAFKPNDFPQANKISMTTLSLPLSAKMNEKDVRDVVCAFEDVYEKNKR